MTRIAVALGGNALIQRGEPGSTEVQRHNLEIAARALVDLAERSGAELILTHGNGPQVGLLAIAAEMAAEVVPERPLDVLGAESQGQIGYLMSQALHAAFLERGIRREIAVVVSQVVVRSDDPAFANPTKPVGPVYDEATARDHAATRGWSIAPDGRHWRRVVPSPRPLRLVEASSVRSLVEAGILVVASGGGGIPVAELPDGRYEGREAVIDKDLAAVVLARAVGAEGLLLLTDVDAVYRGWGSTESEAIRRMSIEEAFEGLAGNAWPSGSMGPKVRACAEFVRGGGRFAAIGRLQDAAALAWGRAGTRFGSGRLGLPPFTVPAVARPD
ncbi:MAG TPA: carbamate kinase [Patescibacteria group bacterium]|nr:carbamate kinase [Patescibacteria group bacterium]